jgi:ComF family protein
LLYAGSVRRRWVFSSSLLSSATRFVATTSGARSAAREAVCGVLDLFFPDDCRVCGERLHEVSRIPVCSRCLHQPQLFRAEVFCACCGTPFLNRAPLDESGRCGLCRLGLNGFDQVYSFGAYEGVLRKLIHLFKFDGIRTLRRPLGSLLTQALPRECAFDAIVPVPLHWRRRWQRGFNQSELLAREIARKWSLPVCALVRRRRATAPQAGLTSAQRRKNVEAAFRVRCRDGKAWRLKGMRLLLIDDVLTTGATASACARALKRAGAAHVTFLALARRDRRISGNSDDMASAASAGRGVDSL